MSDYNAAFLKRLTRLSPDGDAVRSLSGYMLVNGSAAKQLVRHWVLVLRAASPDRVLPLVYVANDVVQRAQARNLSGFIAEFGMVSQPRHRLPPGPQGRWGPRPLARAKCYG